MADQDKTSGYEVNKSDEEWKQLLTPVEFQILREKGTEYAFTGEYYNHKEKGTYVCAGCGNELFTSDSKYDSGCGWPSFYEPLGEEKVGESEDRSLGMVRTEIVCNKCGGHLGHVFPDGPKPTGLRYCVNSASLDFKKEDKKK
jgi:peptide-methionine (R)-S-oxide reductase